MGLPPPICGSWTSGTPRNLYGAAWKAAYDRGAYKKYEQVFDDKRAYARKEAEIVHRELGSRLDLLARSVKTAGPRVVVYNALPWPRSGLAEILGQAGKFLYAEDVPANGYKTYRGRRGVYVRCVPRKPASSSALDTPFYHVTFDLNRGGIASLVEKKTGRELVDHTSPYALGQFLHERFNNQQMADFTRAYARGGYNFARGGLPGDVKYAALTPHGVEPGDRANAAWPILLP